MLERRSDGWYQKQKKSDGSEVWVKMGGETDRRQTEAYHEEANEHSRNYHWNPDKNYRDKWQGLFGGVSDMYNYSPSFGSGPNQNWGGALQGRLEHRKQGDMKRRSHFESRYGTTSYDYQRSTDTRNNAIEDMYRNGYDTQQIKDHVRGKVNINDVEPSYKEYFKARREHAGPVNAADAIRGIAPDEPVSEFWGDNYFHNVPDAPVAGANPITGSPPSGSPSTGGGFMDGYNNTRPIADRSPIEPSENSFMKSYMEKREALANRTSTKSLFKDMIDHE
jgi:hypothetical protein